MFAVKKRTSWPAEAIRLETSDRVTSTDQEWSAWLMVVRSFFRNLESSGGKGSADRDSRPFVSFQVTGLDFSGLLDSGSHLSILGNNYHLKLVRLGFRVDYISKYFSISSATGHIVQARFQITIPVRVRNVSKFFTFVIVPEITSNVILGCDFLRIFKICPEVMKLMAPTSENNANKSVAEVRGLGNKNNLSPDQQARLNTVVEEFRSLSGGRLGRTNLEQHVIDTGDISPIKQRYYPVSPHLLPILNKELDRMLELGVVEPSHSAWNSPVLLVPKANGTHRLCLDSRKLNSVSKRDSFPIPFVANILDSLGGARFLSTIDLKDAFWQIPLEESSKEKTAFTIPKRGLFHFVTMPFGLHAPRWAPL